MTIPRTYALVRVSTAEQTAENQVAQIQRWAMAQDPPRKVTFIGDAEHVSGAAKVRPDLAEVLRLVRAGAVDDLVAVALDRLGRSLVQVIAVLDECHSRGVRVVLLREGVDFGTPSGRLQAQLLAAFAEFERAIIRERTLSGLARARAAGKVCGKPGFAFPDDVGERCRKWLNEGLTWRQIASIGVPLTDAKGSTRNAGETALRTLYNRWEVRMATQTLQDNPDAA